MTETVFARWSCAWCGRRGMASGPRAGGSELPSDAIPVNCFYCFETVLVDAATGLDPRHVRVEGEYEEPHTASCPRCLGDVQTYWDGTGTPLLACLRCGHAERVPEPEVLPDRWEVLYALHGERIERRPAEGGWEFRATFPRTSDHRFLRSARRPDPLVLEAFEAEPARPLKDVFSELRAEGRAQETVERVAPVKPRFPPVKKGHRGPRA